MKIQFRNLFKILIVLFVVFCMIFAFTLIHNNGADKVVISKDNGNSFQHLYLNENIENDLQANNISVKYGTYTLKDFDVTKDTNFNIVVAFANFKSGSDNWKQDDINKIMLHFNDDNSNNEIYSLKEYMSDQSYGNINISATYVTGELTSTYNDFNGVDTSKNTQYAYLTETNAFNELIKKDETLQINGQSLTSFHCRILYFPCDSGKWGSSLWPHAWMGQAMIVSPKVIVSGTRNDSPFTGTFCHEMTHILGIPDLYVYEKVEEEEPVGDWFLMGSTDYYHPQTINAYYKQQLGFIDESYFYDKIDSKIEKVTSSGIYELCPATSQNGVIAFKFGERTTKVYLKDKNTYQNATEYFLVEYKLKASNDNLADYGIKESGLIVYRVVDCEYLRENGNMYPTKTDAKYQIYVVRPNDQTYTVNSALLVNESYGNTTQSNSTIKLTYYDGTNCYVKVTNLGTNVAGQAKVQFEFKDNLYSASGKLMHDNVAVGNANIYMSTYNATTQEYSSPTKTQYTTDEYGDFFVPNLCDKVKLTFYKDSVAYPQSLVVDGKDVKDVVVQDFEEQTVELFFYSNNNENKIPLVGVNIYVNGTYQCVSNSDGYATLNLKLNDKLTFELSNYIISSFTYYDTSITNFDILAMQVGEEQTDNTLQLNIHDKDGNLILDEIQILDITDSSNVIVLPYKMLGDYYVVNAEENLKIRIEHDDYASFDFTVNSTDLKNIKDITLSQYVPTTIKIVGYDNSTLINIVDMQVFVDNVNVGITNKFGELLISKIYLGQTVTFKHNIYKVEDWIFDGTENKQFTADYKSIKVLIKFYRPHVKGDESYDPNNNLVSAEQIRSKVTLKVDGSQGQLLGSEYVFEAQYYSNVSFDSSYFAITDETGKILISSVAGDDPSHKYGTFIIDPSKGEFDGEYLCFKLYAKKYLTLSGKIEFPDGHKAKVVSIFVNNKTTPKATTNELGEFSVELIVEGDKIIFKCDGYKFEDFFAMDSAKNSDLKIKAKEKSEIGSIGLYLLFGILALCFIVPFFIGVKPKGKSRLKEI